MKWLQADNARRHADLRHFPLLLRCQVWAFFQLRPGSGLPASASEHCMNAIREVSAPVFGQHIAGQDFLEVCVVLFTESPKATNTFV